MTGLRKGLLRVAVATVAGAALIFTAVAPATQAAGTLSASADKTTVDGFERFTVSVSVDATPNLFAAQFSLGYDGTKLTAVDVRSGSAWPAGSTFVAKSSATGGSTATESVDFAATLLDGTQTVGAGTLLTVIFEAKDPASQTTTDITAGSSTALILSDQNGAQITATAPSDLTITVRPAPTITGSVTLQSPDASRPVTIEATSASAQRSVQLASGAALSLAVPTGSDYTLTATASCHLSAQATSVSSPSTGNVTTLQAGDTNGDNVINIQDLAAMGSRFGSTPGAMPCTDLNVDGVVNILDLSRAGSNFSKAGPQTWP